MEATPEPLTFQHFEHLYQIYPDIPRYSEDHKQIDKFQTINKRFNLIFGKQPSYFVKCPGAITLFGDQQDYSRLSYIECCTPTDVVVAVAVNDRKEVRVNHFQKSRYPEEKVSLLQSQLTQNLDWRNSVVLAMRINQGLGVKVNQGGDMLVYSDLMDRSDFSKTTALVICLTLGIASANGEKNIKKDKLLAQLSKFRPTFPVLNTRQGLLFSHNNKLIQPSTRATFQWFSQYTLVMAHSCIPTSLKSVQIREGQKHNLRRCEIQLAIELVKAELGIQKQLKSLKQLKDNLGYSIQELIDCIQQYVPATQLTVEEIQKTTERDIMHLLKGIPYSNNVLDYYKSFSPLKTTLHLLKEELLIEELKETIRSSIDQQSKAQKVAQIFSASGKLQREVLEVQQHTLVSKLIQIGIRFSPTSAYKIIGDVTKGNVIFFIQKSKAKLFIQHVQTQYYNSAQLKMYMSDSSDQYIYEVIPSEGASILDPQYQIWL